YVAAAVRAGAQVETRAYQRVVAHQIGAARAAVALVDGRVDERHAVDFDARGVVEEGGVLAALAAGGDVDGALGAAAVQGAASDGDIVAVLDEDGGAVADVDDV